MSLNKNEEILHQKNQILNNKWDILIILDACRYDYFKKNYPGIIKFNGIFKKVVSPATHTIEWLNNTFNNIYLKDVIYISSNAFVNSRGIQPKHKGFTFDGRKHFGRIIDVWDESWDESIGTVHPKEMNKYAIASIDLHRKKRFIIHYLQPHSPYIYYGGEKGEIHQVIQSERGEGKKINWKKNLSKIASIFLSQDTIWWIGKKLNIEPRWMLAKIWYKYGREGIIKGYSEDLKLVLNYVNEIIKRYPKKKIIITADHGERLGERGEYDHGGKRDKEVIEVPWLEIN